MENKTKRIICSYCSIGCCYDAIIEGAKVAKLKPTVDYSVNTGLACPKGLKLNEALASSDRGTVPLLKDAAGTKKELSWDEAANTFARKMKKIISEHGSESVAFISTGQMPLEEMALLGLVTKFGMGWLHGDGNTRQCMASAVVAYKQAFGFDAPPFSYEDLELSDTLVFVGANPAVAHPVLWYKVLKNKTANRKIIVIEPRKTETAEAADYFYPVKPRTDLSLLYAVAQILLEKSWIDEDFIQNSVEGLDSFKESLDKTSVEAKAKACGLSLSQINELAELIHNGKAVSFWWTMGVNQGHQAVRTAQAIINIALMTGNIGRPGTGANSLTGQANAMGSRLFSNTTALPGGYDFLNEEHRNKIAKILDIDAKLITKKASLPYHKIIERVKTGEIKGLWLIATNPIHSWIDSSALAENFSKLDFLVVQDLYPTTETAAIADLYLPAAGSLEKDGTFINSERRVGLVQKVIDPPGQALSDFNILLKLADAWGLGSLFAKWRTPEALFKSLIECTAGQPCDMTGIDGYQMILDQGGIQWPYPQGSKPEHAVKRLFADGKFPTPSGRAKILFDESLQAAPDVIDKEFPLVLLTGRGSVFQFHTRSRTGKVEFLNKKYENEAFVYVSKEDMLNYNLEELATVRVVSHQSAIEVKVKQDEGLQQGQVFMALHFEETNKLTYPSFDPYSAQPSYKHAAVKLEAI